MNYLLDKEFLYELNQYKHKEIFAKIISLSFDEQPLEKIEGKITGGSINIDGNSSLRRTCNLSLVAKDVNITDFYWGISNKFKLEIGLKNFINSNYPDIIWFNQGIFVITSFNSALTNNNYTISINGKDKMCLLNGDIGGNLPASIDFGKIDTYSNSYSRIVFENKVQYEANKYYIYKNGKYEISKEKFDPNEYYYTKGILMDQNKLKLKDIIKEAVHFYAKEPYGNIIINDLDDYGLELLEYRGDIPLYLFYNEDEAIYDQMTIDQDFPIGDYTTSTIPVYNTAVDELNKDRTQFYLTVGDNQKLYSITKIEYGQTAGYRITDLVYAGELISSVGESLTSILDKIKKMLGAFEYFYNIEGKFVFQRKKIYTQMSWNSLVNQDDNIFAKDNVEVSEYSYSFEDMNLIQRFQNTPSINTLKNDYSVWGVRKSLTGAEIPIHARYAIQNKPEYYKAFDGKIYCSNEEILEKIKQYEKDLIINDINDRVQNFQPSHEVITQLQQPQKQEDGSWSPGWWDIRDWHDYYFALRQEEPRYTMKWYSFNSEEGCQKLWDVFPPEQYPEFSNRTYAERYIWLIIVSDNGSINIQHGSGNPKNPGYMCTLYESYIDDQGKLHTQKVIPVQQKYFIPPYSGCSDNHTYLEFLLNDVERDGNRVYFYNPNFPGATSFEEVVEDQINKEFEEAMNSGKINLVDWREIIYQMAVDYYKYNQNEDYSYWIRKNNSKVYYKDETKTKMVDYYSSGETSYEIFYSDIQGFWRQLYDPNPKLDYVSSGGKYVENEHMYKVFNLTEELYLKNSKSYFILESGEFVVEPGWIKNAQYYTNDSSLASEEFYTVGTWWNPFEETENFISDYYLKPTNPEEEIDTENYSITNYYWNKNVINAPELLNFWIDFYEGNENLSLYSISNIGDRPKVVNDNKINSVYYKKIPNVIFTTPKDYDPSEIKTGYFYIWLNSYLENLFTISAQSKSAKDEINDLFNQHSWCSESINISVIPIYNLEPNTLIHLHNEDIGINGKYQITKITIPLSYNGLMSISANKIMDFIY